MIGRMRQEAGSGPAGDLLDALFGPTRRLYKRVRQFSVMESAEVYRRLARRPFPWLVACGERFAELASRRVGRRIAPHEVLFDAPPMGLDVHDVVDAMES